MTPAALPRPPGAVGDRAIAPARRSSPRERPTLADAPPALLEQFHPSRNGALRPDQLRSGSSQRVWWRCDRAHEWQASVGSRVSGARCPFCSGQRPSPERNLAVCFPGIAAEWHAERNAPMGPTEVTPASARVVWWRGPCGHEWQMAVSARTRRGRSCPVCARRVEIRTLQPRGVESDRLLTRQFPRVVAEWHPTRNDPPTRFDLMGKGTGPVWWLCELCGHEWRATVRVRSEGGGCPDCGGTWPRKGTELRIGPAPPPGSSPPRPEPHDLPAEPNRTRRSTRPEEQINEW